MSVLAHDRSRNVRRRARQHPSAPRGGLGEDPGGLGEDPGGLREDPEEDPGGRAGLRPASAARSRWACVGVPRGPRPRRGSQPRLLSGRAFRTAPVAVATGPRCRGRRSTPGARTVARVLQRAPYWAVAPPSGRWTPIGSSPLNRCGIGVPPNLEVVWAVVTGGCAVRDVPSDLRAMGARVCCHTPCPVPFSQPRC